MPARLMVKLAIEFPLSHLLPHRFNSSFILSLQGIFAFGQMRRTTEATFLCHHHADHQIPAH
jgi:hypothetical protein